MRCAIHACAQDWTANSATSADALAGIQDVVQVDTSNADVRESPAHEHIWVQFQHWTLAGAPRHSVHCRVPQLIR